MKLDEIHFQNALVQGALFSDPTLARKVLAQNGINLSDAFQNKNFYQKLEMSSCFVDAYEDVSLSDDTVQLHSHNFYEILCCCSGNIQYLLGTERFRIHRGDIIVVRPGVSHRPLFLDQLVEPYRRYVLWINPELIDQLGKLFPDLQKEKYRYNILRTANTRWEYLTDYFQKGCQESFNMDLNWQICVLGNTMELIAHLSRALAAEDNPEPLAEKQELIDEVMDYIESHMSEKITLESAARHFLVSKSTISQLFRKKLNVSFYRFVTQRRLIAAKIKIIEGETLEQVCSQVGFSDYSAFYRAFKKEYGISPDQFRKMQKLNQTQP